MQPYLLVFAFSAPRDVPPSHIESDLEEWPLKVFWTRQQSFFLRISSSADRSSEIVRFTGVPALESSVVPLGDGLRLFPSADKLGDAAFSCGEVRCDLKLIMTL